MSEDKTIRVTRRRRSGSSQPGDRERATAPRRGQRQDAAGSTGTPVIGTPTQQTASQSYGTQGSGSQGYGSQLPTGQSSSGGTQNPLGGLLNLLGGRKIPPLLLLVLVAVAGLCICVVIGSLLAQGGGGGLGGLFESYPTAETSPYTEATPVPVVVATRTPRPFTPPASVSGDASSWLVMLYQDADDKVLEQDIYLDLNEAERVGSGDQVQIVTQVDRYRGGYSGDGDWTSTKRLYVTLDQDLGRLRSQEIADLGEVNMADGDTLVDFATWAIQTFPADKYVLILSDHGMGWPGGWSDGSATGRGGDNIALAAMGDYLFLMELDDALQRVRDVTGGWTSLR